MVDQKQIAEAIAEVLTLPVADIDPEASLKDDLGLNPVEVADLLQEMAQRFKIVFEPEETQEVTTIGELIDLVEDKLLD